MSTWTAPVRYAETDQQGVVFNAHYLLYCDEAMGAFCARRGLDEFVELVRLKTSALTWHAAARWGETVAVAARCTSTGRTSFAMSFEVTADGRPSCSVETTYVYADPDGNPQPIGEDDKVLLRRDD